MDIHQLRHHYTLADLKREHLNNSPFVQFQQWLEEAIKAQIIEPNAMALATASKEGRPSSRMVLMKKFDETGLVFYTNKKSRKAEEIAVNRCVAVTFFWKELERQVIIEGVAKEISREETFTYFSTRPRGSQLSTWISKQDQIIPSREILEKAYKEVETLYHNQPVPLPDIWSGFCIQPDRFEFWQGRPDRLHDRFQYILEFNEWKIDRLAP